MHLGVTSTGYNRHAYYSSSSSLGKFTVQSSSLKQMGLPKRIDIDLSAGNDIENGKG